MAEREEPARLRECRVASRVGLGLCPCAAHSRPGAGAALRDVSLCLSSRGSGEETHFKSSCTEGEIKAFAAFQSNGSPRRLLARNSLRVFRRSTSRSLDYSRTVNSRAAKEVRTPKYSLPRLSN